MRLVVLIMLLSVCPATASAMNWEGHDDWMESMEPAVIYEKSAPHAAPKPSEACPPAAAEPPMENPYEQVPLSRPDCPAMPGLPMHLR
jgi:hypothetical protein